MGGHRSGHSASQPRCGVKYGLTAIQKTTRNVTTALLRRAVRIRGRQMPTSIPEVVHFQKLRHDLVHSDAVIDSVYLSAVAMALALVIGIAFLLRNTLGWLLVRPVLIVCLLAFVGVQIWFVVRIYRNRKRRMKRPGDRLRRSAPQFRITCVGHCGSFRNYGPFEDVAFEPAVFLVPIAPQPRRHCLDCGIAICAFALAIALKHSFGSPWWDWRGADGMIGAILLSCGVLFGVATRIAVCPTYLRVVPGRLDVMTSWALSTQVSLVRSYDLSRAQVVVDLTSQVIALTGHNCETQISIALVPRRKRLAYMVLLGALSTHEPGPVTMDRLL